MSNRHVGNEARPGHILVVGVLLALGLLAAPASAGTITVGWDLMTEANVTGYRVYVGTQSRVYTETFDVPADKEFFIFRNAFMGRRYYFAVAAQFDSSTYGVRSNEVTAVGTRTVDGSRPGGIRVPDAGAVSDCGADCYVVTELARGLGEITSLAVANDGTVFAVEDARRVVVLQGGAPVTAFDAAPGTALRDITLDAQFDTTGRVFLSMLRPLDRSTGDLEVLRLRYLAGSLGEASTIVTGPSVPLEAKVPLAVGDDGLVYVALPDLISRHPYSAAVLAFDQDGRAPAGQRSPVVARGFAEPVDMAWDAQSRGLWLIGRAAGSDVQILSVSPGGAGLAGSSTVAAAESAAGVAVASGVARRLVVAAGVDLIEETPGTADTRRISLEAYGAPVAVGAGAGARYVATRTDGAADTYRIMKVEDGNRLAAR